MQNSEPALRIHFLHSEFCDLEFVIDCPCPIPLVTLKGRPMASQLFTSATVSELPPTAAERFTRLCVRRRVPISVALLALLLGLDGWIFHGGPRNVTSWADPFVAIGEALIFA